jgi:prepilin-type N-terminal cleavage/methylation domain-containing protein
MSSDQARRTTRSGFTLIELMVVILIIAVVISILIPAVAGVRSKAKQASTQALMTSLTNSVTQFQSDERRLPGYFTEKDMGSGTGGGNLDNGMSEMENVMLDLIGMPPPSAAAGGASVKSIGPTNATRINIDLDLIGTPSNGSKQYFNPDPKFYVAQVKDTQQIGISGSTDSEGIPQLKDVVDAWGMPLLAWRKDETAVQPVQNGPPGSARNYFVQAYSGQVPGVPVSQFYWASNACFLKAPAAGRGFNQPISDNDMTNAGSSKGSMIGGPDSAAPSVASAEAIRSLAAVLGSPSFPYRGNVAATRAANVPAAPRASFIVHSAGADGYFVGNKDKGRKQFSVGHIDYEFNFVNKMSGTIPAGGQINDGYVDKDGKPTTIDVLSGFDDLLATAGN